MSQKVASHKTVTTNEKPEGVTNYFPVRNFKVLEDPTEKIERFELLVAVKDLPENISLEPNPRLPNLSSAVSRQIGETLETNWQNFHLLNRGITILASKVNHTGNKVRLAFPPDFHGGILDGGNTNERLKTWRENLPEDKKERLEETFVNIQVLVPLEMNQEVEDLLNDIKEARNTSVQVKQKSLADARQNFEAMKHALVGSSFEKMISWKEGDHGVVDGLHVVTALMIMFPPYGQNGEPTQAYGHKERVLDSFLTFSETHGEELGRRISLLPDYLKLFDLLQISIPENYPGRFGRIEEVSIYEPVLLGEKKKKGGIPLTLFGKERMKYGYPLGWVYPIFAAFRHLIVEDGEVCRWLVDPFKFWDRHGETTMKRYEPYLKESGYDAKKVGSSYTCYETMSQVVRSLYKEHHMTTELVRTA